MSAISTEIALTLKEPHGYVSSQLQILGSFEYLRLQGGFEIQPLLHSQGWL